MFCIIVIRYSFYTKQQFECERSRAMGKIFYKGVDYSSPTSSGVSGVKGNKETVYRVGNVNITPENVGALAENGDSKDNTVTFTSNDTSTSDAWTDVAVLATGEKHSSIFAKISTMFKNVRYIYTHFIKSENILDTLEEIVANTQSGKVAGALAVKELNGNLLKYESIVLQNTNNKDYIIWNNIPAKYGKIVSIWNDDRAISFVAVTGFSYNGLGSRNLVIHFDSALSGNIRLGLLYMPGN